ncbi:MAG: PAS domain-containing protein [Actinobacteria bacterium]|nr:PAS domain-containing protein [Actinomycetota bacterium]
MRINRPDPDLFEIILRHLKEAVVFADSRGRIQIFNPVAVEFFKVREKQALGKKLERVIPYKIIRKQFDSVYENKEGHHDIELAIHFPAVSEGEAQLLRCSFYPVYDRKGIFIGCLATFADITEKGLLSREISQSKDLSTIGMLARWMAHEIRNPLSSLNINIELLREELREEIHLAQKEEIQSLLNFISYETLRLENNLKEFLDFNRLPPLKFEWVELNDVLDSIARLLRPDAQMKNARIDVHFQKKLPLMKIDVSQINLAISNLLINSIQAVSERGEVHLFTRASKKNVFIIIKDNGTGISKEHLPKIFDFMFSTKPTGSGLGLSIAKKIISDHHGEITVRSELNRGSTFRIRLPLSPKAN